MHMFYELLVFAPCPTCSSHVVTPFLATNSWEPGSWDHPTISSIFRASARLLFCTGISMSCWIIGMLPWHHFRFTAVAPFSFRHGDKCLISCSCQHFHKIA